MLHVHRQISGLRDFVPFVLTQKRAGEWPVAGLEVIPRSRLRFLGRGWEKASGEPWQITADETRRMDGAVRGSRSVLLHIFFGNVAVHMLPLLRRLDVPAVVSFHGADVTGAIAGAGYARARSELFDRSRLVLCRSWQLATRVAALGCPAQKLRIMRTVLPPLDFIPRNAPADGAWRIVQAARLVAKKGIPTSLRAFAAFSQRHPSAIFTIAGEGPMEQELRNLARELGIESRVRFAGFLSQDALRALYRDSHIFLQPSETAGGDVEGVPNAMLEAMACGLPVVTTRHGGISEVVCDGRTGLLCDEGDAGAVADAMDRLASDGNLRSRIARAGSDFVKDMFSADRQIANIERLYREAAGL